MDSSLLTRNAMMLQCRASQAAQLTQVAKLGGSLSLIGGAALCAAVGAIGAAPLVVGGLLYAAATGRELMTTKTLTPLPWAKIDLLAAFNAHRAGSGKATVEVADYQYLSDDEKATYVLCTLLAPATAALLEGKSDDEKIVAFQQLKETLLRHYREMPLDLGDDVHTIINILDDPHQAARRLYGSPEGFLGQFQKTLPANLARSLPSALVEDPIVKEHKVPPAKQIEPQAVQLPSLSAVDLPSLSDVLGDSDLTVAELENVWNASPSTYDVAVDLPTAKSTLVGNPYQSTAIFGAQRTGKSYLAAVASRELKATKGLNVFHINLASYGDEDQRYWKHAKSLVADLSTIDTYVSQRLIERAIKVVEEFFDTDNSLLVIDEFAYIGSKNNRHIDSLQPFLSTVCDKIATLSSTGVKRRRAIWTIAPEFVAGSLVDEAKAVKKLALCLVGISPGKTVDWHGNLISFNQELYQQISNNYPVSSPPSGFDCDRIAYIAGQWRPVGLKGDEL